MPEETSLSPFVDQPVTYIPGDHAKVPQPGTALCLSGGGYRAMLFHLGVFIRLNDAGILQGIKKISSVSGGSISAAVLGLNWKNLVFSAGIAHNLIDAVVTPVRILAGKTIDAEAIVGGMLLPGTISERIEAAYDDVLFGGCTLQHLPDDSEGPRFVINATNVQSGALFRFSKPFMADYLVGMIRSPKVSLAKAVAASSAFPPVLSPCILHVDPSSFVHDETYPLSREPYTSEIILSDGGVYDNMGIETAWKSFKTVLVSDAGGKMRPEEEPKHDWGRHAVRIMDIIDNQVRSLRKRQIIEAFKKGDVHDGTYWSIRSNVKDYKIVDPLDAPEERTRELAATPTRLRRIEPEYQERLINWGYAICDIALRAHVDPKIAKGSLPYPATPI